jgi:tetratricopeptide (TPR) repeat protein
MAGWIPNEKNRNVIPRWRDFKHTLQARELNPLKSNQITTEPLSPHFHAGKINDWQIDRSVKNAIELLNSAIVLDDQAHYVETAAFLQSSPEATKPVKDISGRLLYPPEHDDSFIQLLDLDQFDQIIGAKIKSLRQCLDHNPFNSISWMELGRLFLILGKEQAAERCILVATQLAPDNRYISRVSSRFFTHTGDYKKAKQILKNNVAFKVDPWLISADIGISSLDNKSSFNIKRGRELILSKNYSPYDLNELLSAIATVELNAGSMKDSRKLFDQSLISPNDNSLAQAVWAKNHIRDLEVNQGVFDRTPNVFEAKAYQFFYSKSWGPAYSSIMQWFIDQPFSRDPAAFGSFMAVSVLEKYDDAIKISGYGLRATPGDFTLLNNMAFAYLKKGDTGNAQQVLNKIDVESLEDQFRVVYLATRGLLYYKLGQLETGEQFYKQSSALAGKIKNKKLQLFAEFHHLAIQLELDKKEEHLLKLDALVKQLEPLDVVYLKDLVKNLYKRLGIS